MLKAASQYQTGLKGEVSNKWSNCSDSDLWDLFRTGDEGAFNYIYTTYFLILFKYGYRVAPNRELVLDCIQELFIDLRTKQDLTPTTSIKYFLFKCLKNKILYQLRKSRRQTPEEVSRLQNFEIQVSHEVNLIQQSIDEEKKFRLKRSLSNLPTRQKEAIYYFYHEGFSYQEIASIMGLKEVKSARNIIYKAIRALRQDITG